MTTASDFTTIHEASRARITWEEGKTNVVFLSLELVTQVCVFLDGLLLALVARDPAFLCHGAG